jgi:Aspartyl protease
MIPRLRNLVVGVVLASAVGAAASPPTPLVTGQRTPQVIELLQSDRRVLVLMRIGDGEPIPMVFDTGSDGHSIDRLIVRRHALKPIGSVINLDGTTGKRRNRPVFAVPNVSLGGLRVGWISAMALDYDRADAMGIISPEAFAGSLVSVELGRARARLLPRSEPWLPSGPATAYVGGLPAVEVKLPGGERITANLDSGYNGALSLPVAMMGSIPLMAPPGVVGRFKSIDSEGEVFGAQVRGPVTIGPVTLESPKVMFLGGIANIGLPVLRQLTLVLDPQEHRSWVLPAAVPTGL